MNCFVFAHTAFLAGGYHIGELQKVHVELCSSPVSYQKQYTAKQSTEGPEPGLITMNDT